MHLADGFLTADVCLGAAAVSAGAAVLAARKARIELGDRAAPLMGAVSACIFSAQMVNFPIFAGSSGHLMGAALAAITLGPWAATIAMTTVLAVQCFLFGDGGVTALGVNVLNMAVVAPWVAAESYRLLTRAWTGPRGQVVAAALAGWLSVLAAAAFCAVELSLSGTYEIAFVLPALLGVHAVIGVVEAAITALVIVFLLGARPEMLTDPARVEANRTSGRMAVAGVATAFAIAFFLAPLASEKPDGLESVTARLGGHIEQATMLPAPLADYELPALSGLWLATSVAGVIGALAVAGIGWGLARRLPSVAPSEVEAAAQ